ncbi:hypothetical protein KUTeg_018123 [Tegillarca granosa]|uniref:Uncharacterized protein n=1 Tax=Tegillarca granosa TaxID=220873 RepID=A0ABQ9ELV8_TEGGR|nr:hypothetical protein KUTeg_018123 [Tegillarca granosa]
MSGNEAGNCDYQELMDGQTYFILEQEAAKQDFYPYCSSKSVLKKRNAQRSSRPLPNIPAGQGHIGLMPQDSIPPPIPDRNYSIAKDVPNSKASVMSNRPLPRRPDEAYQRQGEVPLSLGWTACTA